MKRKELMLCFMFTIIIIITWHVNKMHLSIISIICTYTDLKHVSLHMLVHISRTLTEPMQRTLAPHVPSILHLFPLPGRMPLIQNDSFPHASFHASFITLITLSFHWQVKSYTAVWLSGRCVCIFSPSTLSLLFPHSQNATDRFNNKISHYYGTALWQITQHSIDALSPSCQHWI